MVKKVIKKPAGEKKMARKTKKTFNSYIFKVLRPLSFFRIAPFLIDVL